MLLRVAYLDLSDAVCPSPPAHLGTQHGHPHGGVPSLPAEYLWGHPLPAADLDGGHSWGAAGPPHRPHLLLLCECPGVGGGGWSWAGRGARGSAGPTPLSCSPRPSFLQTLLTAISMSAIATNGVVPGE